MILEETGLHLEQTDVMEDMGVQWHPAWELMCFNNQDRDLMCRSKYFLEPPFSRAFRANEHVCRHSFGMVATRTEATKTGREKIHEIALIIF